MFSIQDLFQFVWLNSQRTSSNTENYQTTDFLPEVHNREALKIKLVNQILEEMLEHKITRHETLTPMPRNFLAPRYFRFG